jgi:hypothetical protein
MILSDYLRQPQHWPPVSQSEVNDLDSNRRNHKVYAANDLLSSLPLDDVFS